MKQFIILAICAISFTACDKEECEPIATMAPPNIQEHLKQIEGKWVVNNPSSIFNVLSDNCSWIEDTAYITPTATGFDVLLTGRMGTDCRFFDSALVEDVQVLAQHDGKFLYQPPSTYSDYHFDVEFVLDTTFFNPPDISVDTLLIGYERNNLIFELQRRR